MLFPVVQPTLDKTLLPCSKDTPLPCSKDTAALSQRNLDAPAVRNQLVHDPACNSLDDRHSFAQSFDSVEQELKRVVAAKSRHSDSPCVIM